MILPKIIAEKLAGKKMCSQVYSCRDLCEGCVFLLPTINQAPINCPINPKAKSVDAILVAEVMMEVGLNIIRE